MELQWEKPLVRHQSNNLAKTALSIVSMKLADPQMYHKLRSCHKVHIKNNETKF